MARILVGAGVTFLALALLLAMVVRAIEPGLFLSLAGYGALFPGMFLVLSGAVRLARPRG